MSKNITVNFKFVSSWLIKDLPQFLTHHDFYWKFMEPCSCRGWIKPVSHLKLRNKKVEVMNIDGAGVSRILKWWNFYLTSIKLLRYSLIYYRHIDLWEEFSLQIYIVMKLKMFITSSSRLKFRIGFDMFDRSRYIQYKMNLVE